MAGGKTIKVESLVLKGDRPVLIEEQLSINYSDAIDLETGKVHPELVKCFPKAVEIRISIFGVAVKRYLTSTDLEKMGAGNE